MKVYEGKRKGAWVGPQAVTVDGVPLEHQVRHSDGFEWGYGGSGPADLALSLLWDAFGEEVANRWYQALKWALVAHLPREGWRLTETQLGVLLEEFKRDLGRQI